MDERMQFVARRLAGEPMAELCREFGISRKTGYKLFDRYQECGVQGLTDRSRRPYRYPNQLPFQVENFILHMKHEHPSWGARKIRERLLRRFSGIPIPAKSTVHAVLDRHGLVERRGVRSDHSRDAKKPPVRIERKVENENCPFRPIGGWLYSYSP
jgi:putative transposase